MSAIATEIERLTATNAKLLEVLTNLVAEWDEGDDDPFWNAARAAIAAADGAST
jgi:hypothetical protein